MFESLPGNSCHETIARADLQLKKANFANKEVAIVMDLESPMARLFVFGNARKEMFFI